MDSKEKVEGCAISRKEQKARDRAAFNAEDPQQAQAYLEAIMQPKKWRMVDPKSSLAGYRL